jgi:ATP-dependent DNA helicase RecG
MDIDISDVSAEQVEELLATEEGHFADLKAAAISPASLTKTVSAFANTSGGEIYVGIEERVGACGVERAWRGYPNPEAANAVIQVIEGMSPLGNHYDAQFLRGDDQIGLVLHLLVQKAREVFRATNGEVYIRRGAQNLKVVGDEALQRLKYDKGMTSFEDEVLDLEATEITNSTVIIDFLIRVVPTAEPEVWLSKQRLLQKGRPTVAGVLLFAEEPQAALPKRSAIKVFRYKTKAEEGERDYLVGDPLTTEGPIYDVIYKAVRDTKSIIEGIEKLGPSGLEPVVYPNEALHEIITNAVLHRDYSLPSDVQVRIFDNRVEIESPGRLPGHITRENILKEQFARNPKLVRLINRFPDPPNKDVGEGLNTAFEAMEKLRLKRPTIEERSNSVMVVLRHESLGSPEQLVMDYLKSHAEITNAIGRDLSGIKSENSMKEVFYRLRDSGVLEQVPEKRGNKAAWRLKQPNRPDEGADAQINTGTPLPGSGESDLVPPS